jgi:hypothetical protein
MLLLKGNVLHKLSSVDILQERDQDQDQSINKDYHTILQLEYCDIYKKEDYDISKINVKSSKNKSKKKFVSKLKKDDSEISIYYTLVKELIPKLETLIFYNCTFEFMILFFNNYFSVFADNDNNDNNDKDNQDIDKISTNFKLKEIYIPVNKQDEIKNNEFMESICHFIRTMSCVNIKIYLYDEWKEILNNNYNVDNVDNNSYNKNSNIIFISPMEFINYIDTLDMTEDIKKIS